MERFSIYDGLRLILLIRVAKCQKPGPEREILMNSMPYKQLRLPQIALCVGLAFLQACGGGSGDASVGAGGTGSSGSAVAADPNAVSTVAVGPITGFGSIIVNGVKYDDSSASVSSDDGRALSRSDLRLGMTTLVRGTSNSATGLGSALSVLVSSELKGVVQARTATGFQLLGVTVQTSASTVFENASDVVNGDFVEVYGVFDATSRTLVASRVERKAIAEHKLRGLVSNLNTVSRQFNIGTQLIDYSSAGAIAGLANGVDIKVTGATPSANGAWQISSARVQSSISLSNTVRVEVKAVIGTFTSLSNFQLSGITIDGSSAVIEGGTAASLATGVRVEVKGNSQDNVVRATRIKIEDSRNVNSSGSASSGGGSSGSGSSGGGVSSDDSSTEFEVKGKVSGFVSTANFVVRATRIDASGPITIERGTLAALSNNACVEVKGSLASTASGSVVKVSRLKFDDDCL